MGLTAALPVRLNQLQDKGLLRTVTVELLQQLASRRSVATAKFNAARPACYPCFRPLPAVFAVPFILPPALGGGSGGNTQTQEQSAIVPANPQTPEISESPNQHYYVSALGIEVRAAVARDSEGRTVQGLAIERITPNSPAEKAGLIALSREPRRSAEGLLALTAIIIGSVFPPVLYWWAIKMNDEKRITKSCDLIIGVDGYRVVHVLDLEQELTRTKPGEPLYLNVLRQGRHIQIPVTLSQPEANSSPRNAHLYRSGR